jgi:hypothetical protein
MRIDPTGSPPVAPKAVGSTPRAAARPSDAPGATSEAESFELTGELAAILAGVRQSPEVRAEVIESVAARLAAGELDTPEAAADTARALLATPPEPPNE